MLEQTWFWWSRSAFTLGECNSQCASVVPAELVSWLSCQRLESTLCCRRCRRRRGDIDLRPHWAERSSQRMSDLVADLVLVASIGVRTRGMQFAAHIGFPVVSWLS